MRQSDPRCLELYGCRRLCVPPSNNCMGPPRQRLAKTYWPRALESCVYFPIYGTAFVWVVCKSTADRVGLRLTGTLTTVNKSPSSCPPQSLLFVNLRLTHFFWPVNWIREGFNSATFSPLMRTVIVLSAGRWVCVVRIENEK